MKLSKLLCIVYIFIILFSAAIHAGVITGKAINSETKIVIRDVNIIIIETGDVVSSDRHGEFSFNKLLDGKYRLVASHIAYDPSDTIYIEVNGSEKIKIELNPTPWVLNDVVVTGTRSPHLLKDVPVQTEVITQRDFQRTGATTVGQALESSIGINISEDLSGMGAQIRGIEGDRVLILIDGERAVGRVRGSIDLGQFDLSNVEKIETVKGAGSTLYGSDAMGGVINIITKKPKRSEGNLNLNFEAGGPAPSFGDKYHPFSSAPPAYDPAKAELNTANFTLGGDYGNDITGVSFGGRFYKTDGFDLKKETPHTNGVEKISRYNLNAKLRQKLSNKWSVTGSTRYMFEQKDWIESEVFPPNLVFSYDDVETNKRYDGSVTFDYLSGDRYSMKFRLFGTYYDHDWSKISSSSGDWLDTSATEDIFYEVSYSSNYVIGDKHIATYGFDYNKQDLKSTELIAESKADEAGDVYFQYEYSPHKKWNILSGVRYENHSSFGGHVNPSLNVMYSASEGVKVRGSVGRGFRAPSIKQQYFIFDHLSAGYIVYGGMVDLPDNLLQQVGEDMNPLIQETSLNSSISVEMSYGTMGLHRFTYFYNHLDNLIDFTLIGFPEPYWRGVYIYQNIETAFTQGIEWESRIRLSSTLDMSFSYNYLSTRNLGTGDRLINRPDHSFKFFVTSYFEKYRFGASFWGNYRSRKLWVPRTNTGGNEGDPVFAPHRTTLNMNLFKRFNNGMETYLRIENILDEVNVNYGYWPGITFSIGLKYDMSLNK